MSLWNRLLGRTASTTDSTAERAAWLDQVVRGAANTVGREIAAEMRAMRRNFDTADTPAWTSSWSTTIGDINATLASQLPAMRSRSIGLARNDEWAARWLIQAEHNILGDRGITLTMGLRRRDGQADSEANAAYERFWARWGKRGNCEVSGKLSWREIEGLLLRCEETCGEILYRHRPGSGPLGFRIQILPPQVLDVAVNRDYQGHRVRMGVEIDDEGVPTHYWLLAAKAGDAPTDTITQVGKHVRVPAAEIRHFFHTTEVGQVRGIPGLSVGARRLWLLHDFEEAAAVASSNAAKRQGFFVSPDGNAPPGIADTIVSAALAQANAQGKTLSAAEIEQITAAATKYATTMPGQFDTIPQGYDFRPFESKWPEVSAEGYIKQQIRGWAAARGASYHTLGNDLSDVNYSSAQVGIGDERRHFKVRQQRLLDWVHNDVIGEVLKRAALYEPGVRASRLTEALAAVSWLPPQWAPIDPLKANEADDVALRNKSTSRRRIWLAKGLDPDEMEREILEEEARLGPIETTGRTSSGAAPAGG